MNLNHFCKYAMYTLLTRRTASRNNLVILVILRSISKLYYIALQFYQIRSDQSLSHVRQFVTPWTAACQASQSFIISQSLLKLISIESLMLSNHLILCLFLLLSPSIFPSIRVFSNELALHIRWPKYWSFHFDISPSNEYSGLISFRIDWFDLLEVQRTLKSLQHHNSKASIFQHSSLLQTPTGQRKYMCLRIRKK